MQETDFDPAMPAICNRLERALDHLSGSTPLERSPGYAQMGQETVGTFRLAHGDQQVRLSLRRRNHGISLPLLVVENLDKALLYEGEGLYPKTAIMKILDLAQRADIHHVRAVATGKSRYQVATYYPYVPSDGQYELQQSFARVIGALLHDERATPPELTWRLLWHERCKDTVRNVSNLYDLVAATDTLAHGMNSAGALTYAQILLMHPLSLPQIAVEWREPEIARAQETHKKIARAWPAPEAANPRGFVYGLNQSYGWPAPRA